MSELAELGAHTATSGELSPDRLPPIGVAGVASVAAALPARSISNAEIAERLGVTDEWIASRTGVHERRVLAPGESLLELAADASAQALDLAGVAAEKLDLILFATFTADELQPHAAPALAGRLGAVGAGAIDVGAACCGFVSALALAAAQLESGRLDSALIVGADAVSRVIDYDDPATAALFGDGAGVAVVTAGGPGRIGPAAIGSDPTGVRAITVSNEERLLRMDGRPTFRAAVPALVECTVDAAELRGVGLDEIDVFVYHQANARILRAVGERLALPAERVVDCIGAHGNTSAASIPLALAHAAATGQLRRGNRVLLGAFGAGFTSASTVLDWEGAA